MGTAWMDKAVKLLAVGVVMGLLGACSDVAPQDATAPETQGESLDQQSSEKAKATQPEDDNTEAKAEAVKPEDAKQMVKAEATKAKEAKGGDEFRKTGAEYEQQASEYEAKGEAEIAAIYTRLAEIKYAAAALADENRWDEIDWSEYETLNEELAKLQGQ